MYSNVTQANSNNMQTKKSAYIIELTSQIEKLKDINGQLE